MKFIKSRFSSFPRQITIYTTWRWQSLIESNKEQLVKSEHSFLKCSIILLSVKPHLLVEGESSFLRWKKKESSVAVVVVVGQDE